jgi:hypothetical protein
MATGYFPAEPWRRKGIIVLDEQEIERCEYESEGAALLLNEEVYILKFPVQDDNPVIQDLEVSGLINPGAVLAQSPFDKDIYKDIAQAPRQFALAKHVYFSTFCMYLGAREVNVEQIESREISGTKTLNVKGGVTQYAGDLSAESEELEALRSQLTLHDTFTGGDADVDAAEELLRQKQLLGDVNMSSLLEMRRANTPSQLVSRTLKINLSSEAKRNLTVIGRLGVPGFINLEADYKRIVREQTEFTQTVQVIF